MSCPSVSLAGSSASSWVRSCFMVMRCRFLPDPWGHRGVCVSERTRTQRDRSPVLLGHCFLRSNVISQQRQSELCSLWLRPSSDQDRPGAAVGLQADVPAAPRSGGPVPEAHGTVLHHPDAEEGPGLRRRGQDVRGRTPQHSPQRKVCCRLFGCGCGSCPESTLVYIMFHMSLSDRVILYCVDKLILNSKWTFIFLINSRNELLIFYLSAFVCFLSL